MSFLGKFLGGASAEPIKAVGDVVDELFTSDDERLSREEAKQKLLAKPHLMLGKVVAADAASTRGFQANWRPAIGWCCAIGLFFAFFVNPVIQWATGAPGPELPMDDIYAVVTALLGLGTLRTIEKLTGAAK